MSRKAKPVVIGAFVVGATAIAVAAVGLLASGALFSDYDEYVTYFSESVNGLSVGAPVKFRGITMGQVTQIGLFARRSGDSYAEVTLRLEYDRWRRLGREAEEVSEQNITRIVREGLRSRLEVESIVTGVVFVTLEIRPDAGPPVFVNPESRLVEIPSAASPMSELTESAGQVIARLSNIDVNAISENLIALTETLNRQAEDADVQRISDNLVVATSELRQMLESGSLETVVLEVNQTLEGLQETNELLRARIEGLSSTFAQLDSIAHNFSEGSAHLADASQSASEMLDEDSEFRSELDRVLAETVLAIKSFRRLTNMIEKNPNAFITGKSEDRK